MLTDAKDCVLDPLPESFIGKFAVIQVLKYFESYNHLIGTDLQLYKEEGKWTITDLEQRWLFRSESFLQAVCMFVRLETPNIVLDLFRRKRDGSS
jgi:hypothetical protein